MKNVESEREQAPTEVQIYLNKLITQRSGSVQVLAGKYYSSLLFNLNLKLLQPKVTWEKASTRSAGMTGGAVYSDWGGVITYKWPQSS